MQVVSKISQGSLHQDNGQVTTLDPMYVYVLLFYWYNTLTLHAYSLDIAYFHHRLKFTSVSWSPLARLLKPVHLLCPV